VASARAYTRRRASTRRRPVTFGAGTTRFTLFRTTHGWFYRALFTRTLLARTTIVRPSVSTTAATAAIAPRNAMRKASTAFANFRGAAARFGRGCFGSSGTFRSGFNLSIRFAFEIRFGRFLGFLDVFIRSGFAQDHRLNIEVFVLVEHGRGYGAGLGGVFQVFRFLRADGFF